MLAELIYDTRYSNKFITQERLSELICEEERLKEQAKVERELRRLELHARKLQQQRHRLKLSKAVEAGMVKPARGRKLENFRVTREHERHMADHLSLPKK
jgi:arginine repressor